MNNAKVVGVYLRMRAAKAALTKQYETEKAALEAEMAVVEGHLLKTLLDSKTNSMGTDSGTFYIEKVQHARCEDWDAYHKWLIQERTLDGLEKRVTKSFILEYMKDNEDSLPPGIVVQQEQVVRVRVPTK